MPTLTIQGALSLAVREHHAGQLARAGELYRKILEHDPKNSQALHLLGVVEHQQGRHVEADQLIRQAISLTPAVAEYHSNHGEVLRRLGNIDGAMKAYRHAIELNPDDAVAHYNLGNVLMARANPRKALASYQRAVDLQPDVAVMHVNKAMALLQAGEYADGFVEYEWRWACDHMAAERRSYPRPAWDGSDPAGKTILVYWEQGFGDTIQFIRYAPLLAARGATVVVECQPELKTLLQCVQGVSHVVAFGDPLPEFDTHVAMLSLPRLFGTAVESVPASVPYVTASRDRVVDWRIRLARDTSWCKVGLVWAGRSTNDDDNLRSIPLATLAPLGRIMRANFYSLQTGPAALEARHAPPILRLKDVGHELKDFADTAALLENLDLVITVDTAVAHLAGAMGKPTWVLLSHAPDWRWMTRRTTTPWYPTMSLVRQRRPGVWAHVVERIKRELDDTLR